MTHSTGEQVALVERERIRALLDVDQAAFDRIHAESYRLCNPTGTVWTKPEYLEKLTTGTLTYTQLQLLGEIDAIVGVDLVVLRYRCRIALRIQDNDIAAHQAWHTDVYQYNNAWQCVWSQATGILETAHT